MFHFRHFAIAFVSTFTILQVLAHKPIVKKTYKTCPILPFGNLLFLKKTKTILALRCKFLLNRQVVLGGQFITAVQQECGLQ